MMSTRRTYKAAGAVAVVVAIGMLLAGCGASIHDTVARGDIACVREMLEQNPELVHAQDGKLKTPLHAAVTYRNLDAMPLLLEFGADINGTDVTGMTPLHVAAMLGRRNEAAWLLEHGADTLIEDDYGDTPLHTAAIFGHGQIIAMLAEQGITSDLPNGNGETALAIAKQYRQERVAQFLEHLAQRQS